MTEGNDRLSDEDASRRLEVCRNCYAPGASGLVSPGLLASFSTFVTWMRSGASQALSRTDHLQSVTSKFASAHLRQLASGHASGWPTRLRGRQEHGAQRRHAIEAIAVSEAKDIGLQVAYPRITTFDLGSFSDYVTRVSRKLRAELRTPPATRVISITPYRTRRSGSTFQGHVVSRWYGAADVWRGFTGVPVADRT